MCQDIGYRIRLARALVPSKRARVRILGSHLGEVFVGGDKGLNSYGTKPIVNAEAAHRLDLSHYTLRIGQLREPPCSTYTL